MPPEQNPRFIFTAHCAWCNFEKSSNTLEVELKRPEITKADWQDKDGKTASKGIAGTPIKLYAEVTEFEEGQGLTFTVYDGQTQETVYEAGSDVQDGKAEAQWTYHWDGEELKEKPKYYFEVTANRCKNVKSGEVEISGKLSVMVRKINNDVIPKQKYTLYRNNEVFKSGETTDDGEILEEDLIPAQYCIVLNTDEE